MFVAPFYGDLPQPRCDGPALEGELGTRPFQRSIRHLTLTEAGSLYRRRVVPLIEELDRTHDEVGRMREGPCGTSRRE